MPFFILPSDLKVFIAVSFPSSKGTRYPLVVQLAKGADVYREGGVGKQFVHVAGFVHSLPSMHRAIALLEYARAIRGCMVSNGLSIWGPGRTLRVLRCYLEALACQNHRAHCRIPYEPLDNVYRLGAMPSLLPCRLVECYFIKNWHNSAPIPDQLQAAAVESGCEWCPLFSPTLEELISHPDAILE